MIICPICQSENQVTAHSCHYCGAALLDRKHRAPSRPAPALLSRPKSQYNPLHLEVSETPYGEDLPTMNLTMTSQNSEGGPLTMDISGSEGEPLTIDDLEPVPALLKERSEEVNKGLQLRSHHEPHLQTVDEASDGLAPIDLEILEPHLTFPDEPHVDSKRPKAKLSDLSDLNPLAPLSQELEPRFTGQHISSADPSLNRSILADLNSHNTDGVKNLKSFISFSTQAITFVVITFGMMWSLDYAGISFFSTYEKPSPQSISRKKQIADPTITDIMVIEEDDKTRSSSTYSAVSKNTSPPIIQSNTASPQKTDTTTLKDTHNQRRTRSTASAHTKIKNQGIKKVSFYSLMKRAERLLTSGRIGQAESLFEKAKRLKPKSADPLSQLGWCKLARSQTSRAIKFFKKALSINPQHKDGLYGLGYSYEKLGDTQNALRYFNMYLTRYPKGSKVGVIKNKLRRLKR